MTEIELATGTCKFSGEHIVIDEDGWLTTLLRRLYQYERWFYYVLSFPVIMFMIGIVWGPPIFLEVFGPIFLGAAGLGIALGLANRWWHKHREDLQRDPSGNIPIRDIQNVTTGSNLGIQFLYITFHDEGTKRKKGIPFSPHMDGERTRAISLFKEQGIPVDPGD